MKTNPLVSQRFQELADKADAITDAKTPDFLDHDSGTYYHNINAAEFSGWAASVLNLLQRVFGEDSIHFQHVSRRGKGDGNLLFAVARAVDSHEKDSRPAL